PASDSEIATGACDGEVSGAGSPDDPGQEGERRGNAQAGAVASECGTDGGPGEGGGDLGLELGAQEPEGGGVSGLDELRPEVRPPGSESNSDSTEGFGPDLEQWFEGKKLGGRGGGNGDGGHMRQCSEAFSTVGGMVASTSRGTPRDMGEAVQRQRHTPPPPLAEDKEEGVGATQVVLSDGGETMPQHSPELLNQAEVNTADDPQSPPTTAVAAMAAAEVASDWGQSSSRPSRTSALPPLLPPTGPGGSPTKSRTPHLQQPAARKLRGDGKPAVGLGPGV
ncbi:unnamed protein product, partial [Discosporangium mesarthrocarpum]